MRLVLVGLFLLAFSAIAAGVFAYTDSQGEEAIVEKCGVERGEQGVILESYEVPCD